MQLRSIEAVKDATLNLLELIDKAAVSDRPRSPRGHGGAFVPHLSSKSFARNKRGSRSFFVDSTLDLLMSLCAQSSDDEDMPRNTSTALPPRESADGGVLHEAHVALRSGKLLR